MNVSRLRRYAYLACIPALLVSAPCTLTHPPGHLALVGRLDPRQSSPPRQDALLLWLEGNAPGGGSFITTEADGRSARSWSDVRGRGGITQVSFEGRRVTVPVLTPAGSRFNAFALRCGSPLDDSIRCSYVASARPGILDGQAYSVLAVVRQTLGRGDNYFLMTEGHGCNPAFGGTGCAPDSALHLGWWGERTLKLGQYDHDVVLDSVPSYDQPPLSLIFASSGPSGLQVGLLDPTFNGLGASPEILSLSGSGRLFIGGTPWGQGNAVPNWRFTGDILALLVYTRQLTLREVQQATAYLRNRFGPA
jgi:hypothetical protein